MLPETELLQYIYKTADMGCEGIRAVVGYAEDEKLKTVLNDQMSEYKSFCNEAEQMLKERNAEITPSGVFAKASADVMSAGKLMMDHSSSKIAEMTIQGNNMGISKTIQHLHDYGESDGAARKLTERLLEVEKANVEQLKPFL